MLRFPAPLRPGDLIAVTAPSSGIAAPHHARLDLALAHLQAQGYRVVEGQCLREQHQDASAPADQRAAELMGFLTDPEVAAVLPPRGGERATELLDLLDFDALASLPPKWFGGFSDISTLALPLVLRSGWATVHGPNLLALVPAQTDALSAGFLPLLAADLSMPQWQQSSPRFQRQAPDTARWPEAPFNLAESTRWRRLDGYDDPISFQGRLIGGCIDALAGLAGTRFGDVPRFVRDAGDAGTVLYLENCELTPPALLRTLLSLRRHGWFDGLAGLLIGRSAGLPSADPDALAYDDALHAVLGDLRYPVLIDVDIGHLPPQLALINGAWASVHFEAGAGRLSQRR